MGNFVKKFTCPDCGKKVDKITVFFGMRGNIKHMSCCVDYSAIDAVKILNNGFTTTYTDKDEAKIP